MPGIGIHGRGFAEPALGYRVLPVIAIAFILVIPALIGSKSKISRIGIHIPHLAVGPSVGRFINLPQTIVTHIVCITDDGRQTLLQRLATLAYGGIVISGRRFGPSRK